MSNPRLSDTYQQLLVLGASGAVGRYLLRRLHGQSEAVTALSRNTSPAWARPWPTVAWHRAGLPGQRLADFDAAGLLLSAGPLDALAEACERSLPPRLRRVVALSSMSVRWKWDSPNATERALARRLRDAEQRLCRTLQGAGVELVLLRPSMIYGAGTDRSLSPLLRLAQRWRLLPWPRFAVGLRAPIHADDLAAAMIAAASSNFVSAEPLSLGGLDALPYDRLLDRLVSTCAPGARRLPLPLPRAVFRFLASGRGRRASAAASVYRAAQDQTTDASAWSALALTPREFKPAPEDFRAWPS